MIVLILLIAAIILAAVAAFGVGNRFVLPAAVICVAVAELVQIYG